MAEKKTSDLYLACRNGDVDAVKRILPSLSFADVNRVESNGSTALHAASYYGHAAIVQLLLERGADTNIKNKYQKTAKEEASMDDIQELFEQKIKSEESDDDDDDVPQSKFVQLYPNKEGMDTFKLATCIFKARLGTYNVNKYTISAESTLEHLEQKFRKLCEEEGKKSELQTGEVYFKKYRETGDFTHMIALYAIETPFYRMIRNDVTFLVEMYKHLLRYKELNPKGRAYCGCAVYPEEMNVYRWALNHRGSLLEVRTTMSSSEERDVALQFLYHATRDGRQSVLFEIEFYELCFMAIKVHQFAQFPGEREVLILPGTFFEVTKIREDDDGITNIFLKHVPVNKKILSALT